jgi:hypothetical protein
MSNEAEDLIINSSNGAREISLSNPQCHISIAINALMEKTNQSTCT